MYGYYPYHCPSQVPALMSGMNFIARQIALHFAWITVVNRLEVDINKNNKHGYSLAHGKTIF